MYSSKTMCLFGQPFATGASLLTIKYICQILVFRGFDNFLLGKLYQTLFPQVVLHDTSDINGRDYNIDSEVPYTLSMEIVLSSHTECLSRLKYSVSSAILQFVSSVQTFYVNILVHRNVSA